VINKLIIITLSLNGFVAPAYSDESNEMLDEAFLEFLADLENVDNTWTHPVDFDDENIEPKYTTNKITASETNNE